MNKMTPEKLAELRKTYPKGCRIRLIRMNDPYRPDLKEGAMGTVIGVDDMGTVHTAWDCGSSLGVVYGEDYAVRVYDEEENDHENQ